jgi:hypothetical protein
MGKYERFDNYKELQQKPAARVHPIWGGIGCLLLVIIPIVAYAAADTFFDRVSGTGLELFGLTIIPRSGIMFREIFSFPIWGDAVFRISLFHFVFMVVFIVIGFLIFSLVYAIIYRFTGPPKYGPTDSPPLRRSKRKRR